MKMLFTGMALLFLCFAARAQTKLQDGFYLVAQTGNDSTRFDSLDHNRNVIDFNPHFRDDAPANVTRVSVFTNEWVPLELDREPSLSKQGNGKNALDISMKKEVAAKLGDFTKNRIMRQVVIVMDAEVLTMRMIREAITGGRVQISSCSDGSCERLLIKMKEHLKK